MDTNRQILVDDNIFKRVNSKQSVLFVRIKQLIPDSMQHTMKQSTTNAIHFRVYTFIRN